MGKHVALTHEILRGIVGSTVHGTAIEGQDDRDEMGVFVEPPEYVCGLSSLDHYVQRDQPDGVRSKPGDLDLVLYSFRKFCRLAAGGNPSVLLLLFLPEYITRAPLGSALIAERDAFFSRKAGHAFLGYLVAQRRALTGDRSPKVSRPDIVARYGYDTKFAMHALRLGYQGLEYLRTRRITLPVPEPELTTLRAVRAGQLTLDRALELIRATEAELSGIAESLKEEPDYARINHLLVAAHKESWRTNPLW